MADQTLVGIPNADLVALQSGDRPRWSGSAWTRGAAERVNAKDYGAVGDGSTNDTSALQSFVTDVVTNAKAGILPAGNYKITSRLDFPRRAGWSIRGAHQGSTTITQATDNTPILYLGSDTASFMNTWEISGLNFTYTNSQPSSNTSAIPILFNCMAYEGKLVDCTFSRGSYATKVSSGIICPWGCTFDNLQFGSGLTIGAMDWSPAASDGVPNNRFGRLFADCENMIGPVFWVKGSNFYIDTIECIRATQGPNVMTFASGTEVVIGCLKIENGTWTSTKRIWDFSTNSTAHIGQLRVEGNSGVVNIPGGSLTALRGGDGTGAITVDSMAVGLTTLTAGSAYAIDAPAGKIRILGRLNLSGGFVLQNNSGTVSAENITVDPWRNNQLSTDKGDADYTVTLGDPNIVTFQTAFTAQRTITLPGATANNCFNGLQYKLVFNGAINGANTALIKSSSTTLRTQTVDKVAVTYTWRRHATAPSGWVLTGYETLP